MQQAGEDMKKNGVSQLGLLGRIADIADLIVGFPRRYTFTSRRPGPVTIQERGFPPRCPGSGSYRTGRLRELLPLV